MSSVNFVHPDITLHLDDQGVIREASVSGGISDEGMEAWIGRSWLDTVGDSGEEQIRQMLDDAATSGVSAFRDVLQRFPSGRELPIEYTTVRAPGGKGGLLALGKNLQVVAELQSRLIAAQRATEREYWKLRDVETRYRLLFDASNEAVLMIDGEDLRIVEANPAAVRALGLVPGWEFPTGLSLREREAFVQMLQRVREQGRAPGMVLHFGPRSDAWVVRASLMAAEPGLRYLLNVAPAVGQLQIEQPVHLPIEDLIDRLPDGFLVIGADGIILRANQAFLDMVQVGANGAVQGESLGRWLCEPGADIAALLASVQRSRAVSSLETMLHGELGGKIRVEVSATGNQDSDSTVFAVVLRDTGRRLTETVEPGNIAMPDFISGQLGKAPLLQVVKIAGDLVERQMIEAALDRVGGNRTAAAELLGLSRQSLHTKLNRHAAEAADHASQLTGAG